WERLADEYKGITLEPLFTSKKPNEILALVQQAREMDSTYAPTDFLSYFAVNIPVGVDAASVAKSLSTWPWVSVASVDPPPIEPPIVNATDDPRSGNQGYLDPAPD